jgi:arylformamidase
MSSIGGRVYDVSLPLVSGGLVFPGDPVIRISPHQTITRGDPANVSRLAFGSHTGTHVDAASHFLVGGAPVDAIPLDRLIGPAVVLHIPDEVRAVGESELRSHDLRGIRRVLLRTRNSSVVRSPEFVPDYCYLARDGAGHLLERGVELVGIDYLSIERYDAGDYPVHRMLLERRVVIVEGLDLSQVPAGNYHLVCLPLRLAGLDGAPARAVLIA